MKHSINRRRFIQSASAAAMTAPSFIPGTVLAAEGRPSANEQVSIGIIGMGMRGNQLARDIPAEGQIVAICDADERKNAEALKTNGANWKVFQDYRAMMDRDDLDAVIVAATDLHHVHAAILACMAGKDVYIEKPLSLYVNEGRALVNAARKYDRVVQTGTQQRSMEMNQFACELVRDGGIGDVKVVECVNYKGPIRYADAKLPEQAIPQGMDWELWQGQAPARPYHEQLASHWTEELPNWWGTWHAYSGRQMTGLGAHAFDMVQYAMGMDESGPVEFWPVENDGPDPRVDFRYANGVEVRLRFADEQPYRGPRLGAIFSGTKCKIEINRNKFTTNPPDFVKDPPDPKLAEKWEGEGWLAQPHLQDWLTCIKTRQRPVADVEIGHRTATVCHLCSITRDLGRRLKWDPQRERFVDDEQANGLLDRPRRKGWELPTI